MPTLKGTETSLSCIHCFLYFVSSSIKVYFSHAWLDTFWTDLAQTQTTVVIVRGKGGWVVGRGGQSRGNGDGRDFAWGDGHMTQCADILLNCTLETCMVL